MRRGVIYPEGRLALPQSPAGTRCGRSRASRTARPAPAKTSMRRRKTPPRRELLPSVTYKVWVSGVVAAGGARYGRWLHHRGVSSWELVSLAPLIALAGVARV